MIDVVLNPLVAPMAALVALLVLLVRRRRRCGVAPCALCAAALVLLVLASSTPVSTALLELLEGGQSLLDSSAHPAPDAILVLGAGLRDVGTPRPVITDAGKERLLEGVRLARAYPSAVLVFSGGDARAAGTTSAEIMAAWAAEAGVAPERVIVERRSRSTHENATELAALVRERGFRRLVVVTSARHMPRSLAAFRAVGLAAGPAPCDFTDAGDARWWLVPSVNALARTHGFLHEVVGRAWYRLRGWA